jgi:murein DD-endopeptidase MepM/ murein hydrolase activator NlpD
MHIRSLSITGSLILALSPALVIGIDPTTSGRILDSFKAEQKAILFENIPFDEKGINDIYEKEYLMAGIEGLKNRVLETASKYETKKNEMAIQRWSLEDAIAGIENTIADTVADIHKIENQMKEKNQTIDEYESLSIDLSIKIKKNRQTILTYLANIFSEWNTIYGDGGEVDILQSLILTAWDTDEVGRDIMYKSLVSSLGQQFIDDYRALIKEYYLIEMRLKEELASLSRDQDRLDTQKKNLIAQRTYREQILEVTKWREELYAKYIASQIALTVQLENSWKDAHEEYTASLESLLDKNGCNKKDRSPKDAENCGNILTFYRNERALRKVEVLTGTTNVHRWPVTPTSGLSSFYKDPAYYLAIRSQHEAIDIPVPQWTDIKASMGGYVYYILPPVSWWYSYMAIKHPDGYFTVYGHLSEILVQPYQFVEAGDVIARSGWAPGTPWAWPMTTGPHLHFEVFKDKESIDPLRVLDISKLDYESIPSRYQDKFISDIIARSGTGTDISWYERRFIIQWETEQDRQKYLLRTYATTDFQNWDTWADAALDARIDPSFLMCVGLAETTLGNHMKTLYNIWNVGNTDSGAVRYFATPRAGIAAMASTFNNRYLSQYTYVSELSRWGNDDGTIYASSNANWHNNIIRCISSLKWRFVEDKYNFRLNQ